MTPRARHGEPTPTPTPLNTGAHPDEPTASKRDLKSWWKTFSRGNQKREEDNKGELYSLLDAGRLEFAVPAYFCHTTDPIYIYLKWAY